MKRAALPAGDRRLSNRPGESGRGGAPDLLALAAHQLRHLRRDHRPAQEVALSLVAAIAAQLRQLLEALDALSHHVDAEPVGHGDDRPRERRIAFAGVDVAHEGTVDLDPLDWEALEVA